MRRLRSSCIGLVAAACAALVLIPGAAPVLDTGQCECEAAKAQNGWCSACDVGWVAAVRIESRKLFDAIDAHGHKVDPTTYGCKSCQTAIESDGFCDTCKTGFVRKEAYFSRLTWALGLGTVVKRDELKCPACIAHQGSAGWCERCSRGLVGHFAYTDRGLFKIASRGREVLIQAIAKIGDCEDCAVAMAIDRWCPICRKSYEDGELVEESATRRE